VLLFTLAAVLSVTVMKHPRVPVAGAVDGGVRGHQCCSFLGSRERDRGYVIDGIWGGERLPYQMTCFAVSPNSTAAASGKSLLSAVEKGSQTRGLRALFTSPSSGYFLPVPFCASALAAAVFEAADVRPSRSTFDAAVAAFALVCLLFAM
jgi:hypothetical protein